MAEATQEKAVTLPMDRLSRCATAADALLSHALLTASPDGIEVAGVDAANVALFWTGVEASGEPEDGSWEHVAAINCEEFAIQVSEVDQDAAAAWLAFSEFGFPFDIEPNDCGGVQAFDPDNLRFKTSALDDLAGVEYEHRLTLPAYRVHGVLAGMSKLADTIRLTPGDGELTFESKKNIRRAQRSKPKWGDETWTIKAPGAVPGDPAYYSASYLRDIAPHVPYQDDLEVWFGADQPLGLVTDDLRFHLAPRIYDDKEGAD